MGASVCHYIALQHVQILATTCLLCPMFLSHVFSFLRGPLVVWVRGGAPTNLRWSQNCAFINLGSFMKLFLHCYCTVTALLLQKNWSASNALSTTRLYVLWALSRFRVRTSLSNQSSNSETPQIHSLIIILLFSYILVKQLPPKPP